MEPSKVDYDKLELAMEDTLDSLSHVRIQESSRIRFDSHIASGGFGNVYVGTLQSISSPAGGPDEWKAVAIKQFRSYGSRKDCVRVAAALARELKIWSSIQHPNILHLLGFYINDKDFSEAWIITTWQSHGNLSQYVLEAKPSLLDRLGLAMDIARGLAYLHGLVPPICHADVKPENALVNNQKKALLCDFGLSRKLGDGTSGLTTTTVRMTFRYASPEQVNTNILATLRCDVWSWACLLMEVVTDRAPYEWTSNPLLAIGQDSLPVDIRSLAAPTVVKEILRECWTAAERRPSIDQCITLLNICVRFHAQQGIEAELTGSPRTDQFDSKDLTKSDERYQRLLEDAIQASAGQPLCSGSVNSDSEKVDSAVDDVFKQFQEIVGSIFLLASELSVPDIARFAARGEAEVRATIQLFHPTISITGPTDSPSITELSFEDFIGNPERCLDHRFLIDPLDRQGWMALRCFQLIEDALSRKIFDRLGTDSLTTISGDRLVDKALRPIEEYAVVLWGTHLSHAGKNNGVLEKVLNDFLVRRVLVWLKVMAVLDEIPAAALALAAARDWLSPSCETHSLANDAYRLMGSYDLISDSGNHVHLSSTPFVPLESRLHSDSTSSYPTRVEVVFGKDKVWPPNVANLKDFGGATTTIDMAPDGKHAIVGTTNGALWLWDVVAGVVVRRMEVGHTAWITSVRFSPSGMFVASSSRDRSICVWDVGTGLLLAHLEGHESAVNGVTFSPDGNHIASVSSDSTIRIWNVGTEEPIRHLLGQSGEIYAIAFSADSACIASGSSDGTVAVWDANEGSLRHLLKGINSVRSEQKTRLRAGSESFRARPKDAGQRGSPRMIMRRASKDGVDSIVAAPDVSLGEEVPDRTDRIIALAFSADGLRLAAVVIDGAAWIILEH